MKKLALFIAISFGFSWTIAAMLKSGGGLSQPMAQLYKPQPTCRGAALSG